jgi:hypothetical protein
MNLYWAEQPGAADGPPTSIRLVLAPTMEAARLLFGPVRLTRIGECRSPILLAEAAGHAPGVVWRYETDRWPNAYDEFRLPDGTLDGDARRLADIDVS